jgi:hypothetical protein
MGLVSRVSPVQAALRNCTRDEGRERFDQAELLIWKNARVDGKIVWTDPFREFFPLGRAIPQGL